jgi:diaminohydroxyphosphoribosylaminopyrimidine deaminase/5-amino-6-(5-phosphoribosylamino)uracil reductase
MGGNPEQMRRALAEAAKARGRTQPNPMVGCVIVRGDEIVAVGHHARAGKPHAEQVALRRAGPRARDADVYVTLEPCNHHGRTGPCAEALIAAGVSRVFVGMRDPNSLVNGRGIRRLRQAGIATEVGLLAGECARLNEAYAKYIVARRPFVVAKIAQSLDGRIATRTGASQWITGERSRRLGHRLRNELDAILVGRGTIAADDPQLTCRLPRGRDPIRILLDSQARTPTSARVVQLARSSRAPTWIVVGPRAPKARRAALERAGVETIACKLVRGGVDIDDLLDKLGERQVMSLLVEGGPSVLGSFVDAGAVDKLHAFVAPILIGGVGARPSVGARGVAELTDALRLEDLEVEKVGADLLLTGYPRPPR